MYKLKHTQRMSCDARERERERDEDIEIKCIKSISLTYVYVCIYIYLYMHIIIQLGGFNSFGTFQTINTCKVFKTDCKKQQLNSRPKTNKCTQNKHSNTRAKRDVWARRSFVFWFWGCGVHGFGFIVSSRRPGRRWNGQKNRGKQEHAKRGTGPCSCLFRVFDLL